LEIIKRTELKIILDIYDAQTYRMKVLTKIKNNNIRLTGKWGVQNERPLYNSEKVDELLAKLDMRESNLHSKF
jgi:hypothetical protein